MSFVSYAQNFEDVMLWRALKDVDRGFYFDVGAWSPDADSVTRAFYERGWHGINVEPNPAAHAELERRRPRDRNVQVAVSDQEGRLAFNILENPGLSTLDDGIAAGHGQVGWGLQRQEVRVTTLASLWSEHVPVGSDVHFLKVDVEGLEEAVLRGNDWLRNRPWIVLAEATLPMSQVESYAAWEPILLSAGYLFAYADGLNRFYVAGEHPELLAAFKYPPNVFDTFVLSAQHGAEARAAELMHQLRSAEARAHSAAERAASAKAELQSVLGSRSWRVTKPLRWLNLQATLMRRDGVRARFRAFARKGAGALLRGGNALMTGRPAVRGRVLSLLGRTGQLDRLRRLMGGAPGPSLDWTASAGPDHAGIDKLTPRAREIFAELKSAHERAPRGEA